MEPLALADTAKEKSFGITLTSKLKHAALYVAAKKCGSQSALAEKLEVRQTQIGDWINLKNVPPFMKAMAGEVLPSHFWPKKRIKKIEKTLFDLTGQTLQELFPLELCANKAFLEAAKEMEQTKCFDILRLASSSDKMLLLPSAATEAAGNDLLGYRRSQIAKVLKTLSYREQEIIKLRYGLRDGYSYTLEEVGHIFKATRERIRQIEAKAIRKLQQPSRRQKLMECLE